MSSDTVSIRELRTDFRSVRRKIEEHGQVIVTDNGIPAYELKPIAPRRKTKAAPMPDYMARLIAQRAVPMSKEDTRRFWEEEHGDR